jgi:hypothetical protein
MGYNTVVMFLNDNIHECKEHAQEVMDAIYGRAAGGMDDERVDNEDRPHIQNHYRMPYQISVPTVHHADQTVLIAVGGNCCTKLLHTYGYSHHTEKDQVRLLKEWAEKLGYRINKKLNWKKKYEQT